MNSQRIALFATYGRVCERASCLHLTTCRVAHAMNEPSFSRAAHEPHGLRLSCARCTRNDNHPAEFQILIHSRCIRDDCEAEKTEYLQDIRRSLDYTHRSLGWLDARIQSSRVVLKAIPQPLVLPRPVVKGHFETRTRRVARPIRRSGHSQTMSIPSAIREP